MKTAWMIALPVALSGCASWYSRLQGFEQRLNVPFAKPEDGVQLTMDIYRPLNVPRAPIVLVIHGGGWARRSGDMAHICETLAKRGYVALNMTYRLAPKHLYPKAVEDVRTAIQWVREHANELNANANELYLWGYSAGGHLSLLVGLDPSVGVKGIISGAAPTDLTVYPKSPLVNGFLGVPRDQNLELWRAASPVNAVRADSPPVYLYHGAWDLLVEIDQMKFMENKLREVGVPVETHTVSALGHVGVYAFSWDVIDRGLVFLERNNRSPKSDVLSVRD